MSSILETHKELLPQKGEDLTQLPRARWLKSQREVAFYDSMDLLPEDLYEESEAPKAISLAESFLRLAQYSLRTKGI